MKSRWDCVIVWASLCFTLGSAMNTLPYFTHDMNNLALSESTPVGTVVYKLQGVDPENMPLKYSIAGTDKFSVNPDTGDVTLVKPLDRETQDTLKFLVSIEDEDPEDFQNLSQAQSVTVIVLDENDNPPIFKNNPYQVSVSEDAEVGTTVMTDIIVEDTDSVGDSLEVYCIRNGQSPDVCDIFEIVTLNSTAHYFLGSLVLMKPLNYNERQFYKYEMLATDGVLNTTAHIEIQVIDTQNTKPVFISSLSAALSEDAPVGSLVLTIKARDGDRAQPRNIHYELLSNPMNFFDLDSKSGELRIAKPLDRDFLTNPLSPIHMHIQATELVNGTPVYSNTTSSIALVTITIKDVNDEPPRFNWREYYVKIPENLPHGTPLPNLDMVVVDPDLAIELGQRQIILPK